MLLLLADLDIATRTVAREAYPESYDDRRAICHALKNRWDSTTGQWKKDDTLATVCLRHLQFSVWTPSDPNFSKLFSMDISSEVYLGCLNALTEVLLGAEDVTLGSRHYHTRTVSPNWSEDKTPCYETVGHLFFNNVQ